MYLLFFVIYSLIICIYKMEENSNKILVQFSFQSLILKQLQITIQNKDHLPLTTFKLAHQQQHQFTLSKISQKIFIYFINKESQVQQKMEYKFNQKDMEYKQLSIEKQYKLFKVNMIMKINNNQSISEQEQEVIIKNAKQHYSRIQAKVMKKLISEKLIIQEKKQNKPNFIRKPKGKKNLTTILVGKNPQSKNSNHSSSELMNKKMKTEMSTYGEDRQFTINQSRHELHVIDKDKDDFENKEVKVNLLQTQENIQKIESKYQCQNTAQESYMMNIRIKTVKRIQKGPMPKGFRIYLQKLQSQTIRSLNKQKQALNFLHLMIRNDFGKENKDNKSSIRKTLLQRNRYFKKTKLTF